MDSTSSVSLPQPATAQSSSPSTDCESRRDLAKIATAKKWADRRKKQEEKVAAAAPSTSSATPTTTNTSFSDGSIEASTVSVESTSESRQKHRHVAQQGLPPLCVILRKSIQDVLRGINGDQCQIRSDNNNTPQIQENIQRSGPATGTGSKAIKPSTYAKRSPFPSVLSILQANELTRQVETLVEENDTVLASNQLQLQQHQQQQRQEPNVIMPPDYDFDKALRKMTESRSRAFLLLDLASIVRSHIVLRKQLPKRGVKMVFSTRHNTNGRFLQLLHRIGVDFRVSTSYDYDLIRNQHVQHHNSNANSTRNNNEITNINNDFTDRQEIVTNQTENTTERSRSINAFPTVWDDCTVTLKPPSFYRRLIVDSLSRLELEKSSSSPSLSSSVSSQSVQTFPPLTVDGVDDMESIHSIFVRVYNRRITPMAPTIGQPCLSFLLRLDNIDPCRWKDVISTVTNKADELSTALVGVTFDFNHLSHINQAGGNEIDDTNQIDQDRPQLESVLQALTGLLEFISSYSSSVENKENNNHGLAMLCDHRPQVHLTIPLDSDTIDERILEWINNHSNQCSLMTVDVSRLLVVNAAALCARIIGVKHQPSSSSSLSDIQQEKDTTTNNNNSGEAMDKTADHDTRNNHLHIGRVHYYIDDGRYGLLSNYPNVGQPIPLQQSTKSSLTQFGSNDPAIMMRTNEESQPQQNLKESEDDDDDESDKVAATVWGPTCDGLDKVCGDIVLPSTLSRDDWLVFPDLGFVHVGTSFNGFAPPDVACCVIGGHM